MNLTQLKAKLGGVVAKMRNLIGEENYDKAEYDRLKNQADTLKGQISTLEEIENLGNVAGPATATETNQSNAPPAEDPDAALRQSMVQNALAQSVPPQRLSMSNNGEGVNDGFSANEERDLNNFRLVGFCRDAVNMQQGSRLEGLNREIHQEAIVEARNCGVEIRGMGIPHNVLNYRPTVDAYSRPIVHNSGRFNPRNDMVAGTTTAGGHVIDTELRSPIDALRSSLRVREMGATVMTGLVGDIDFPRWAQGTSPAHKAENAAADEYDPTLSKFTMSPNRLPVFTEVSNQLLIQESTDVESWLRTELGWQQAKVIDTSALTGDGTSNAPTGLTNFSGVNVVALGANGAAPTRDSLIDLETAIAEDDADEGVMGFLTTPGVKGFFKKLLVDAGSGQFVWPQGQSNELEGYRALTSTNVPNDLTKGTGTALNAIFFGVWSNLMIGQWGGVDIITNPFSRDTEGLIRITFTTFYDVNFRHPEGFAIIKDADIS